MHLSAIGSMSAAAVAPETPKSAPAPSASSASLPEDTVTLSSAAQKGVSTAGDVDHDGDSH